MKEREARSLVAEFQRLIEANQRLFVLRQGKGWPQADSDTFIRRRDQVIPAIREQIVAVLTDAPTARAPHQPTPFSSRSVRIK